MGKQGTTPEDLQRARRNRQIHALARQGVSRREIARRLKLDVSMVGVVLRSPPPELPRPSPLTTDTDYSDIEREWLAACERYRQSSGRPYLLATDYLRIALQLDYRRGGGASA